MVTPQMIVRKLIDMNLVGRAGTYLEETEASDVLWQRPGPRQIISIGDPVPRSPGTPRRLEACSRRILPDGSHQSMR